MQSHVLDGHGGRIFSIALSQLSDGRRIAASASHDRTVKVWNIDDLSLLHTIEYSDFVWRVFIVVDPKPLVIAFVSTEDKIQVSDLLTGTTENIFYGRLIYVGSLPLCPNPVIITSVCDEDLAFNSVLTGQTVRYIKGGFEKAFRAVIASNPRCLLVFTTWNVQNRRSTIQTYDLGDKEEYAEDGEIVDTDHNKMTLMFEGDSSDGVTSLVITNTHHPLIVSGHYDAMVRLWCIRTKQLTMVLEGHQDYVGSVAAWRGHLPYIVSGSSDGTIKVWNTQTGELIATGEGHLRDVWAVSVTHGAHPHVVSGSFDRTLRVWDVFAVLRQRNWNRRKAFCMVICKVLKGQLEAADLKKMRVSVSKTFQVAFLCQHVASYL